MQGAIQSILARLKYFKTPPANGVVFFVGETSTVGDQTKMVQYVLEPPDPITTFLYRCDSEFYLEPLQDMLLDKKVYGLIVDGPLRGDARHPHAASASTSSATSIPRSHPSTAWAGSRPSDSSA